MRPRISRRHALRLGTAGTLGYLYTGSNLSVGRIYGANEKLRVAGIGIGGKGSSDIEQAAKFMTVAALCDIDEARLNGRAVSWPAAKKYFDYRKLFDEMAREIDAVTVSTADHSHAPAAVLAMRAGKHVYCQKPLTQTVYEARQLRQAAQENKIVTQMGNQGSAEDGLRRGVEAIQAGIIGHVREVHIWTNRPIWPQGIDRPPGEDPIPAGFDWNLWIGPAPMRPFKKGVYHTFNWRGWMDFGTGALGDMACHTVNLPFRGLHLGYPTEIEAVCENTKPESYPLSSKIRFEFPARQASVAAAHKSWFHHHDTLSFDPVTLWWYDGGQPKEGARGGHDGSNKPPVEITADVAAFRGEVPGSGCLLIGEKGTLFSPDDYGTEFYVKLNGEPKFLHFNKHPAVAAIPQTIPRNPFKGSADQRHHLEWVDAIKNNQPELCYSRFEIGARLTEIMVLGCVSIRTGQKLEWDGPNMKATNVPDADRFIKRTNREGWI